jgi:hypothetical protein
MSLDVEDLRKKVYLRLGNYGLADKSTDALLDMYFESVALKLAALDLKCLLRTEYVNTDTEGKFSIDKVEVVPFLVFAHGVKDQSHSWQRLTPVDYIYFTSWDSRGNRGGTGMGHIGQRYTVLPSPGEDGTYMQILEAVGETSIKIVYYPIRPPITDFPNFARDLVINMTLEQFIMDRQDTMKDRSIKMLMDDTKRLLKDFKAQVGRIEVMGYDTNIRNQKTRDWIMSESDDFSYWR